MSVTFTKAQLLTPAGTVATSRANIDFPAATVHRSAVVVYVGDHNIVDTATITFNAKGTTPTTAARPTAVMALSAIDMQPERLGCTFGACVRLAWIIESLH